MKLISKIYWVSKDFIYKHIEFFMALFSIGSFLGEFSLISIAFFVWNYFNRKAYLRTSFIFFSIAIFLNAYYFISLKPWADQVQKEWNKTGFDIGYKETSQTLLNVLAKNIEDYKQEKGYYPLSLKNLDETQKMILNYDMSFRLKRDDGKVNGISYYYERIDINKFYLSAIGPDGIGKTDDDIVPQIFHYQEKSTGLVKYKLRPFSPRDRENGYIGTKDSL